MEEKKKHAMFEQSITARMKQTIQEMEVIQRMRDKVKRKVLIFSRLFSYFLFILQFKDEADVLKDQLKKVKMAQSSIDVNMYQKKIEMLANVGI